MAAYLDTGPFSSKESQSTLPCLIPLKKQLGPFGAPHIEEATHSDRHQRHQQHNICWNRSVTAPVTLNPLNLFWSCWCNKRSLCWRSELHFHLSTLALTPETLLTHLSEAHAAPVLTIPSRGVFVVCSHVISSVAATASLSIEAALP